MAKRSRAGSAAFAERGVPSDGESFTCEDALFTICPWWDGPLTRDRVAAQLAADASKRSGLWVWVHHAPPDKSPTSWAGNRYLGDAPLSEWITEFSPDVVFSGHVHRSPFTKGGSWVDRIGDTWVFNAGHQFGAPPAHIIVDTAEHEAIWMSAAGVQSVRLDQPLTRPVPRCAPCPPGSHCRIRLAVGPGVNSGSWLWMRLASTSLTMAR